METRPSTFKPAYVRQAKELYAQGLTDRELAAAFGVSRSTIFRWRAAYPEFAEATKLGKDVADDRVERALYERAIGYEEEAVRVYHPADAEEPVIVRYQREVRPDVTAALQWMRARRPGIWARPMPPPEEDTNWAEEMRRAAERIGDQALPEFRAAYCAPARE
ncbi:helix-turn-helix domain-containing protein [Sphingomonas sp. So64.6b]|uniref:helix-turn-helix domain-containing protein n=1 Tax=Sphingomonas sp. So64.6b TaxID=2997354 RepID=UPI001601020F|nr:helix-turn-helix domain-containing protein [Sphingomonas sp. So64.6b]QNA82818.1 helix-turn-helix domain-containing protein [Sphingomonas sp. So64.6b]